MKVRELFLLTKETILGWQRDQVNHKAAALAYYATFSMAPLLVLVITFAGIFGGSEAAHGLVMSQIQDLVGVEGKQFVQDMIEQAALTPAGLTASIIGTATLLLGAIGAFNQLQAALNKIWGVELKPVSHWTTGVKEFIFKRLLSFSMLVGVGFLLLVSLVINAGLSALGELVSGIPLVSKIVLDCLNALISFALIAFLFAMIFRYIPDVRIQWRNVWLGAIVTSALFTIGKTLIGLYLGRSEIGSTFGAAGSLVLIMLWIYYSSQIVFFGAEFTQVYTEWRGEKLKLNGYAKQAGHQK